MTCLTCKRQRASYAVGSWSSRRYTRSRSQRRHCPTYWYVPIPHPLQSLLRVMGCRGVSHLHQFPALVHDPASTHQAHPVVACSSSYVSVRMFEQRKGKAMLCVCAFLCARVCVSVCEHVLRTCVVVPRTSKCATHCVRALVSLTTRTRPVQTPRDSCYVPPGSQHFCTGEALTERPHCQTSRQGHHALDRGGWVCASSSHARSHTLQ